SHYENFPVASWLCPAAVRPAVIAIYGFARTADDLADEGDATPTERLAALAQYRSDLQACAQGLPGSGRWSLVFDALAAALGKYRLPLPLLGDLLSAFEQDVVQHHYDSRAQLLDYCSRSATPVGRLLLHLYGIDDPVSLQQSDAICSALQLINFWQDLSEDLPRGRIYLPRDLLAEHGLSPEDLRTGQDSPALTALLHEALGWARALMLQGAPLVRRVPGRAGWELRLVVQGGLRIAERVHTLGPAVLHQRLQLGPIDVALMVWRSLRM
ncbi:MAG: squalene synthase HpnC, partial [Betaproteobacteria bacterium]